MSGGGFFGGADSGSQGNGREVKKTIRPIRSLMVSQVLSAEPEYNSADGPLIIDEHPVSNAVLCVELLDVIESDNSKRLKVGDSTGIIEIRLPSFEDANTVDYSEHYNRFGNLYGYFRMFAQKPSFDFSRFEFDINPYQFLYHEIEAARESYHFQGLIPLDKSLTGANENPSAMKDESHEEPIFVGNGEEDNDLKERILGIIRGVDDNDGDGVTTDYIAAELNINETELQAVLVKLQNEGEVYDLDNRWRAN